MTNTDDMDRTHAISWQAEPVKDKLISPSAMMIYVLIVIVGPILCLQPFIWTSWYGEIVSYLSAAAVFFSILIEMARKTPPFKGEI
jgi:hypothetical protein